MNKSLEKVNALQDPQAQFYIYTGNPQTLRVLDVALGRLTECSARLGRVGRPPPGNRLLQRAHADLRRACVQYERFGALLREAVPLLSSSDREEQARARNLTRRAGPPSRLAARYYGQALQAIQESGVLRGRIAGAS
jgi:hypothetical protein